MGHYGSRLILTEFTHLYLSILERFGKYSLRSERRVGGTYLHFDRHSWRQVGGDVLEGHVDVGVLHQRRGRVVAVDEDYLEAVAVAQIAQLARKVYVSCGQ